MLLTKTKIKEKNDEKCKITTEFVKRSKTLKEDLKKNWSNIAACHYKCLCGCGQFLKPDKNRQGDSVHGTRKLYTKGHRKLARTNPKKIKA